MHLLSKAFERLSFLAQDRAVLFFNSVQVGVIKAVHLIVDITSDFFDFILAVRCMLRQGKTPSILSNHAASKEDSCCCQFTREVIKVIVPQQYKIKDVVRKLFDLVISVSKFECSGQKRKRSWCHDPVLQCSQDFCFHLDNLWNKIKREEVRKESHTGGEHIIGRAYIFFGATAATGLDKIADSWRVTLQLNKLRRDEQTRHSKERQYFAGLHTASRKETINQVYCKMKGFRDEHKAAMNSN